jgi:hypothetical protein
MNLIDALQTENTTTDNGMTTSTTSLNNCVDLFFQIGAMRGMGTKRLFAKISKSFNEDPLTTMKIIFWARDVRGGAGERQIFRHCLSWLCDNHKEVLNKNVHLISEYGRWDDILTLVGTQNCWETPLSLIKSALKNEDRLCAKWMPRKGVKANIIRKYLKESPKKYRKLIVGLTNVVETKMCAKDWSSIEYSKLPSLASSRYQKAFNKNDEKRYTTYKEALVKGETTINTGAIYPYDVTKSVKYGDSDVAQAQWDNLPNFMEGTTEKVLPLVDVSGSMGIPAGSNINLTCMDVAISLGLYISERNEGAFKDSFITFSSKPELLTLSGSLSDRFTQMNSSEWGYSTNLQKVYGLILDQAVKHNVPQSEMPTKLLILSDMEFNEATSKSWDDNDSTWNPTAQNMAETMFKESGYHLPEIIYWNLQSRQDNVPVSFNKTGTALISGFSPAIMKSVLSCDNITPYNMMWEVISNKRYDPITI